MQTELNKIVTALQEFYGREAFLLEKDLGERTLTHRLAVHCDAALRHAWPRQGMARGEGGQQQHAKAQCEDHGRSFSRWNRCLVIGLA